MDNVGNFYVTGIFGKDEANIPFTYDQLSLDLLPEYSDFYRTFILKGDSLGNGIWLRKNEGKGKIAVPEELTIHNDSILYFTGMFNKEFNYDGIHAGSYNAGDHGSGIQITKIDSSGNGYWSKKAENALTGKSNEPTGLLIDTAGSIFLTGNNISNVQFPPLPPLNVSGSYGRLFIIKISADGIGLCQKEVGGIIEDLSLEKTTNYFYSIGGSPLPQALIEYYHFGNIIIQKWNNNCELLWEMTIKNSGNLHYSINENFLENLIIYPNPTQGEFKVKVEDSGILKIFNVSGQLIYEKFVYPGTEVINLAGHSGLHTVQLLTKKGILRQKIQLF